MADEALTCAHCLGPGADPKYVCDQCGDGKVLCASCAREAGLMGVAAVVKDQQAKDTKERIAAAIKRRDERERRR